MQKGSNWLVKQGQTRSNMVNHIARCSEQKALVCAIIVHYTEKEYLDFCQQWVPGTRLPGASNG
jgi:hypothetical protein